MIDDLKIIKKKYGEEMMHFCRDAFATILETPGVLSKLLLTFFEPSKELFFDLHKENLENSFKAFIYRKFNKEEPLIINDKSPEELLANVGYDLYECLSEDDIQRFKKYYAPGEELCTFNGGRLIDCYVFFAVKKDVDSIKREDFKTPERQDLYGTSVISIQFDKNEAHTLSIKNRYNHRVTNPDATFSNNLDNIVEGLTASFEKYYTLKQGYINSFEIPDYIRDYQGKYYKYNYEINGINYCPNNCIIVNHEAIKFPKERYILADYFLIDRQEKTIKCYDERKTDSFTQFFQDNPIKKIDLEKKDNIKIVKIATTKGLVTLKLDKENKIIGLTNPYIEEINDYFLKYNKILNQVTLPKVKIIGFDFLKYNQNLKELDLPNVIKIDSNFLQHNKCLNKINLPKVESIGLNFLDSNQSLKEINFPNILEINNDFLYYNNSLEKIILPKIKIIGSYFLAMNKCLKELYLPNVESLGYCFLHNNESLIKMNLPRVKVIHDSFLYQNIILEELNLPLVIEIGSNFLRNNKCLKKLNLPKVLKIDNYFLYFNRNLEEVIINNDEAYQEFLRQHSEYKKNELTRKLTKGKEGII